MDVENLLDLYTDYLIVYQGQTTATGLSSLSEGKISHDQVTRLLSWEIEVHQRYGKR